MLTPSFLDATGVTICVPGALSAEIIADCTTSGDVSEAVEYWVNRLGFSVPEEHARSYLSAAGLENVDDMDSETLARYVLWLACPDDIFDDESAFSPVD